MDRPTYRKPISFVPDMQNRLLALYASACEKLEIRNLRIATDDELIALWLVWSLDQELDDTGSMLKTIFNEFDIRQRIAEQPGDVIDAELRRQSAGSPMIGDNLLTHAGIDQYTLNDIAIRVVTVKAALRVFFRTLGQMSINPFLGMVIMHDETIVDCMIACYFDDMMVAVAEPRGVKEEIERRAKRQS